MRINWRKWTTLISIYSVSLFALFHFQNCAPAPEAAVGPTTSNEVRVIDDWNRTKVNLVNSVLTAAPTATTVQAEGLCDRHMDANMPLTWEVRDPGLGGILLAGSVDCQLGGFRIQISDVNDLVCNQTYALEVRTVDGESAQAVLVRSCAL